MVTKHDIKPADYEDEEIDLEATKEMEETLSDCLAERFVNLS